MMGTKETTSEILISVPKFFLKKKEIYLSQINEKIATNEHNFLVQDTRL